MTDEKRRFTRIVFKVNAEMTVNNVLYSAEEIINLSVGGCLLPMTEAGLEPGTGCHVRILIGGTSSEMSITVDGEIKRSEPGTIAVKFVRIDPDSLFHLQNVIRYNSPDPEAVDREISEHHGIV